MECKIDCLIWLFCNNDCVKQKVVFYAKIDKKM